MIPLSMRTVCDLDLFLVDSSLASGQAWITQPLQMGKTEQQGEGS